MKIRGWLRKTTRKVSLADLKADIKYVTERLSVVTDPTARQRLEDYRAELKLVMESHPKYLAKIAMEMPSAKSPEIDAARDYQSDRAAVGGGESREAEIAVDDVLRRAGLK